MPVRSNAQPSQAAWAVACAACGSCCNSAPLSSLPELFRHQSLFIGALGLRRIRRIRAGEVLGAGYRASEQDQAASERIAAECLHAMPGGAAPGDHLLLSPLGFEDPGLGRCPALDQQRRCTVHSRHEPAWCSAVPFDPLMPDRLQHVVLAQRRAESRELGARCIARTADPQRMSVDGPRILDGEARRALTRARRGLADDRRMWGRAICEQLGPTGVAAPASLERVPTDAFLVLPLAPVLALVAAASPRCRERCLDYLDAQIVLGERATRAQRARQDSPAAGAAQLHGLVRANRGLRGLLLAQGPAQEGRPGLSPREVEAWLEPTQPEVSSWLGGGAPS